MMGKTRLPLISSFLSFSLASAGCGTDETHDLEPAEVASSNVGISDVESQCDSISLDGYQPPAGLDSEIDAAIDDIVWSDVATDYLSIKLLVAKYIEDQHITKYVLEHIGKRTRLCLIAHRRDRGDR